MALALAAGLTAAAVGGTIGFARGVAQSIDSDRQNGILSSDSIGSAYIHGLIGGAEGAAAGFAIGTIGTVGAVGTDTSDSSSCSCSCNSNRSIIYIAGVVMMMETTSIRCRTTKDRVDNKIVIRHCHSHYEIPVLQLPPYQKQHLPSIIID